MSKFEDEFDNLIAKYKGDLDSGRAIALKSLLDEIELHNYTVDNVKAVIRNTLDELNNQYEADAKADHFSEEQFNEQV